MIFLGTGAAEMYPNPFCGCTVCERARAEEETPRLRSALLLDRHNLIDFGPDVLAASLLYHVPLTELENVFITHTHEDHFSLANIDVLTMTDKRTDHWPVRFYLSARACDWLGRYIRAVGPLYAGGRTDLERLMDAGRVTFQPVRPYEPFKAGGMRIFPVESNHRVNDGEYALNYLFDRGPDGKLLYVADAGLYNTRNLEALRGAGASRLVMEGTFGSQELDEASPHLNAAHFIIQVERFVQAGIIRPDAAVYVTHINQCNTFTQTEYQTYMESHARRRITVAYDGMEIA